MSKFGPGPLGRTAVRTTVGRRNGPGPMGQGPWARAQSPITPDHAENYCSDFFFLRNTRFHENQKEPQRYYESIPTSSASRSLICVRKRRKEIITKHPLLGWATATMVAAEEFPGILHPPIPSHPGIKYRSEGYMI